MPETTRIVKGVSLNGHTSFTDYGDYSAVYNMSTYDQPTLADGSVSWSLEGRRTEPLLLRVHPGGQHVHPAPLEL